MEYMACHKLLSQRRAVGVALSVVFLTVFFWVLPLPRVRSHASGATSLSFLQKSQPASLLQNVANSTLGFQKIFCLGLVSRTDHRDAVELSAAATGLTVDWIDGVTEVENKALPAGDGAKLGKEGIGSWRAHMNALQRVVKENLTSALILEDDADWDLHIKQQMQDFALSSRALTQPLSSHLMSYADPTYPTVRNPEDMPPPTTFDNLPLTESPKYNPYGDDWDVLWLGHCGGLQIPGRTEGGSEESKTIPRGLIIHPNDPTVPEPHYLRDFRGTHGITHIPSVDIQNHTRIVHHPQEGFCSVAYAVSQRGARKMLWYMAVRAFDGWFDTMLPHFCEGKDLENMARPTCITVQPQFFDQHVPRGDMWKESDIFLFGGEGFREVAKTPNIRWSTRINLPKLVSGDTDYIDQFPDTG